MAGENPTSAAPCSRMSCALLGAALAIRAATRRWRPRRSGYDAARQFVDHSLPFETGIKSRDFG